MYYKIQEVYTGQEVKVSLPCSHSAGFLVPRVKYLYVLHTRGCTAEVDTVSLFPFTQTGALCTHSHLVLIYNTYIYVHIWLVTYDTLPQGMRWTQQIKIWVWDRGEHPMSSPFPKGLQA
jgi:hypothetical protein